MTTLTDCGVSFWLSGMRGSALFLDRIIRISLRLPGNDNFASGGAGSSVARPWQQREKNSIRVGIWGLRSNGEATSTFIARK